MNIRRVIKVSQCDANGFGTGRARAIVMTGPPNIFSDLRTIYNIRDKWVRHSSLGQCQYLVHSPATPKQLDSVQRNLKRNLKRFNFNSNSIYRETWLFYRSNMQMKLVPWSSNCSTWLIFSRVELFTFWQKPFWKVHFQFGVASCLTNWKFFEVANISPLYYAKFQGRKRTQRVIRLSGRENVSP